MSVRAVARKRDLEVSEVIYDEARPKKLKLIIPRQTLTNHLEQLDKNDSTEFRTRVLLEVRQFYPLKPPDAEVLFFRLISACSGLTGQEEVKLLLLETLRQALLAAWFPTTKFAFEVVAEQVLNKVKQEKHIEATSSWLELAILLVDKITVCSDLFYAYRDMVNEFVKHHHWKVRCFALRLLTELELKIEVSAADERKQTSVASVSGASYPPTPGPLSPTFSRQRSIKMLKERSASQAKLSVSEKASSSTSTSDEAEPAKPSNIEQLLIDYAADVDARVRAQAVELLWYLNESGHQLKLESYVSVCALLGDESDSVRVHVLRLVWHFAKLYPDNSVAGPHEGIELRLIDDAFSKLCHAMHDLSIFVRKTAAEYLGTLTAVSEKFLEQTLDKKLMSKLTYLKTGAQRQREAQYSEWSSGRKFGADAPAEKTEEDSISMIPSGACGAFVTGLEDEYMIVREAAVDAVCKLAENSPRFATLCLDFLADMFNDEIAEVRLRAIHCLRRICQHIVLKEEQVEVILNALDDASADSRDAVRELLGVCSLATLPCMTLTLQALLANLKRYPHDRMSILRCLKKLGVNHSAHVALISLELLGLDPIFETAEADIEDHQYIAKLVLVLNAASRYPVIKAQFRAHIWRHYEYLRHSEPGLVATLSEIEEPEGELSEGVNDPVIQNQLDGLLTVIKQRYAATVRLPSAARLSVFELLVRDLRRLCELKGSQQSNAGVHFLRYCIDCQLLLQKLTVQAASFSGSLLSSVDVGLEIGRILEALKLTFNLELLFSGQNEEATKCFIDLRLRALTLLLAKLPEHYFGLFLSVLEASKSLPVGRRREPPLFDPRRFSLPEDRLRLESVPMLKHRLNFAGDAFAAQVCAVADDNFVPATVKAKMAALLRTLASAPFVLPFSSTGATITSRDHQPAAPKSAPPPPIQPSLSEPTTSGFRAALPVTRRFSELAVEIKESPPSKIEAGEGAENRLRRLTAEITAPASDSETVVRFTAGLIASVDFEALFDGFTEEMIRRVRLQIVYPDQRVDLFRPRFNHFRQLSRGVYRLRTQALFSHTTWTEASTVELRLALMLPGEFAELKLTNVSSAAGSGKSSKHAPLDDARANKCRLKCLEFAGPVCIKLLPKARC